MATTLDNKVLILSQLLDNQDDFPLLEDFIYVTDIGLPLAWASQYNYSVLTGKGEQMIIDTFDALLKVLNIEDTGFDNVYDLVDN